MPKTERPLWAQHHERNGATKKVRAQDNVAKLPAITPDPYYRWRLVGDFLRLVFVSSRIGNLEAPLNAVLVGPPGDGKTKMILRGEHARHVRVLSDMTYMGVCMYIKTCQDGFASCLVVPDLATLVGRKLETGKQTIAALAMLCAEGVRELAVGKRIRDFGGVQSSVISAVTPEDLMNDYRVFNQNAFLSRTFLIDFDLTMDELRAMMHRKSHGDRALLRSFAFPRVSHRDGLLPKRDIRFPRRYAELSLRWWEELTSLRSDRAFGFRSADALQSLLMTSAYLRGSRTVAQRDVQFVEALKPLWLRQFRVASHVR